MAQYTSSYHRRSIRLKGYDYSRAGVYFVTIVTWQRLMLFGKIKNGEMKMNRYGDVVQKWWDDIPGHFPNVETGAFIIMPNHVHGIIIITDNRRGTVPVPRLVTGTQQGEMTSPLQGGEVSPQHQGGEIPPQHNNNLDEMGQGERTSPLQNNNLDEMGQGERTSPLQNNNLDEMGQGGETPPLRKPRLGQIVAYFKYQSTKEINVMDGGRIAKLWQRNYYEHIIRDKREMENTWKYIQTNPAMWAMDDENPAK